MYIYKCICIYIIIHVYVNIYMHDYINTCTSMYIDENMNIRSTYVTVHTTST